MFESIVEIVADHAEKNPDKLCAADKKAHIPMETSGKR